ncbi:MAG: response regulator transcription factor [Hyphomicrobiaceae bacterium]
MTQSPRILVADDEPQIHRFLRPSLMATGYDVIAASTGAEALRRAASDSPHLIILDLGLPDMDGKDVLTEIRRRSDVPVIVLSARDREAEKIAALDLGADDYVNKPFAIGELLARIRSALRRRKLVAPELPTIYRVGAVTLDTGAHQVRRGEATVHLTPKEFELLLMLARYSGRVITHRQILTEVWGPAHGADTQYLRVFIGQLRQKLEDDPASPKLILTEPGIGYRIAEAA